ncbi:unnamed protein product, partial [Brassica rapa subsp. trilocularis]
KLDITNLHILNSNESSHFFKQDPPKRLSQDISLLLLTSYMLHGHQPILYTLSNKVEPF